MSLFPRPTLRCLEEDLFKSIPRLGFANYANLINSEINLSQIELDILKKASNPDLRDKGEAKENIRSIKDNAFWKISLRSPSTRGAIWLKEGTDESWVVAVGPHREGEKRDFYVQLEEKCVQKAKEHRKLNPSYKPRTYSNYLLPTELDRTRLKADIKREQVRELRIQFAKIVEKTIALLNLETEDSTFDIIDIGHIQVEVTFTLDEDFFRINMKATFEEGINGAILEEIAFYLSGQRLTEWGYTTPPSHQSISMFTYVQKEEMIVFASTSHF